MLDTQNQTLVTLVIICVNVTAPNEFCGNEADPPWKNGERSLLAHQGGMWAIQKAWVQKFAKKLHEGCVKKCKFMQKDQ